MQLPKKEPEKIWFARFVWKPEWKNFSSFHPNLTPFLICIILLYACQAWLWEKKDDRSWSKVLAEIAVTIHTKKIIHIVIYFLQKWQGAVYNINLLLHDLYRKEH